MAAQYEAEQGSRSEESGKDGSREDTTLPPVELNTENKKKLLKLGSSRAVTIKDYLVLEHDIEPGRLFLCLPELDESKDAKSRVDLEI